MMKLDISFDDGTTQDLQVIELLAKYDITATFYIPIKSWGFDNLDRYKDHEIGCHTVNHPSDLKALDDNLHYYEITVAKDLLENKLGKAVTKFCPPRGRYNQRTIDLLKRLDFTEMRTTVITDEDVGDFTTVELNIIDTNLHFFNRTEYNGEDWMDRGLRLLQKPYRKLVVWGHTEEIIRCDGSLDKLDKFLTKCNENRN